MKTEGEELTTGETATIVAGIGAFALVNAAAWGLAVFCLVRHVHG